MGITILMGQIGRFIGFIELIFNECYKSTGYIEGVKLCTKMNVDGWTDGQTDGWTDGQMDKEREGNRNRDTKRQTHREDFSSLQ